VYSRASVLLLDDVLSAGMLTVCCSATLQSLMNLSFLEVDAHTAHHLYHECLKGDLMQGRTVILVSHHVQLCAPGASYIVALDNGRVQFHGDYREFQASGVMDGLVQSGQSEKKDGNGAATVEETIPDVTYMEPSSAASHTEPSSESSSTTVSAEAKLEIKKVPRVLVEEEKRAVGRVSRNVWATYILAFGNSWSWTLLITILVLAALSPVAENWWLK
jgi:ABC-type glutathione transport system ATPase component